MTVGLWILMFALVALSAFFSSSEISYATSNKLRLHKAAEDGSRKAILAERISGDFSRFLSTVLVGNNLVNIAFSSCMTVIALDLLHISEGVSSIIATVVLLVLGEIIPKIIGTHKSDSLVTVFAIPLRFFMILFYPIVWIVNLMVNRMSVLWTPKVAEPDVTDDELVTILETIEDEGVFTEKEGELIRSAIQFSDVTAHDILIPRVDTSAWDLDDDINVLLNDSDMLSYSRIPVYRETIDNIVGILSTKKLIKAVIENGSANGLDLENMLMPPIFVHMTRNISSILLEFKTTHSQMAIVVDEFGGTMGILTLEDILEEIVGDIFDESDDIEEDIEDIGDDTYIVNGITSIDDFFEHINYRPAEFNSEYTTMGGWAVERLDRFPVTGDTFSYDIFDVTVEKAETMRVETLKIKVNRPQESKAE